MTFGRDRPVTVGLPFLLVVRNVCQYGLVVTLDSVARALAAEIDPEDAEPEYLALYSAEVAPLDGIFAVVHEKLNNHFRFMNTKMNMGRHFNAENSRNLIDLMDEIGDIRKSLKRAGVVFEMREDYKKLLEECRSFLVYAGGSPIPDALEQIDVERFEPVMFTTARAPQRKEDAAPPLTLVGEGSFAFVHKYDDPLYNKTFAVKRARPGIAERDLARFRAEFDLMRNIRFPYIVEAYEYDENRNAFTMEYCDETLGEYIRRGNATITWPTRKRVALQFLYGLNYLHLRGLMHRDISRSNVLVKKYDMGAVLVKLSDFGLHKHQDSDFTRTDTEMKGSIIDPLLESFKDFRATNDIYAAGALISFIFTGKVGLGVAKGQVGDVVDKATSAVASARFDSVAEMIAAVEALEPPVAAAEAGATV